MADKRETEIAEIVTKLVTESLARILPLVSQLRRRSYNCTGESYDCDVFYICDNNNHSCRTDSSFACGGKFSCTGGPFGIVVER
jgi:hypothetical protein